MHLRITSKYRSLFTFFVYLFIAIIAYFPLLDNNFFSDDFDTIHRLTVAKSFWIPSFFRPLSDASLILVNLLAGPSPGAQYGAAILMLAAGAFLFYHFAKIIFSNITIDNNLLLVGGVLFILYPFHFESLAWCVGRGSMQAALLALWSMYFFIRPHTDNGYSLKMILLSQLLYFFALATYESVFVLPAIIFFIAKIKTCNNRKSILAFLIYGFTLLIHIAIRVYISGTLFGNYQKDGFEWGLSDYFLNYSKALSRVLVMPMLNTNYFAITTGMFILLVSFLCIRSILKSKKTQTQTWINLGFCTMFSLITAAFFSVSVKTSEGDRLLFLPSIFVILLLVLLLNVLKENKKAQRSFMLLFIGYFSYNLSVQHQRWNKASEIIDDTMLACKKMVASTDKQVAILNLPDTYLGAYVFRHGFNQCLSNNGIDSVRINAIAYFMEWDFRETENPFSYKRINDSLDFNHYAKLIIDQNKTKVIIKDTVAVTLNINQFDIWYWDKENYEKIYMNK